MIVTDPQARTIATLIRHWLWDVGRSIEPATNIQEVDTELLDAYALCTGRTHTESLAALVRRNWPHQVPIHTPAQAEPTPLPVEALSTYSDFEETRLAWLSFLVAGWQDASGNSDCVSVCILRHCTPVGEEEAVRIMREARFRVATGASGWDALWEFQHAARCLYATMATHDFAATRDIEVDLCDGGATMTTSASIAISTLYPRTAA